MNIQALLTLKGHDSESRIQLYKTDKGEYRLSVEDNDGDDIPVSLSDNCGVAVDFSLFSDKEETVRNVLIGMFEQMLEAEASGIEATVEVYEEDQSEPYSSRDIYVENKPFSIKQLILLIEDKELELNPDFQRNFVWDRQRQSLLIESILLGLPLPSIYLSQYDDGRLTVVDGLQRISTINAFVNNKLRLTGLEYLKDCNGKTFEELKSILPPLSIRQFNQTQIGCFVIDYRSPDKLKFDLFRRLNTGGKHLNRAEIRNCLTRPPLQAQLRMLRNSEQFLNATDRSVGNTRMQSTDLVLRYLFFRSIYTPDNPISNYGGKIENELDGFTSELNRCGIGEDEITGFLTAMDNSAYLFGKEAFRKKSYAQTPRRLPINQLLFTVFSVLLSHVSQEKVEECFEKESMTDRLWRLIESSADLKKALASGTNAKWNISRAFIIIRDELLSPLFNS